ncbi:MAG: hypothetical protein QM783_20575 [Phycisphaerales bacterium]
MAKRSASFGDTSPSFVTPRRSIITTSSPIAAAAAIFSVAFSAERSSEPWT